MIVRHHIDKLQVSAYCTKLCCPSGLLPRPQPANMIEETRESYDHRRIESFQSYPQLFGGVFFVFSAVKVERLWGSFFCSLHIIDLLRTCYVSN